MAQPLTTSRFNSEKNKSRLRNQAAMLGDAVWRCAMTCLTYTNLGQKSAA